MALFIPTFGDMDAEDLACIFLSQVFAKHGTLTNIISDWGKHFISQFWRFLCQLLSIKANLLTAYHPETNGQTEQVNQILEQYLQVYVCMSIISRMIGLTSYPWPSFHTTILHTLKPWSPPSLLTRVFTPNLKCPSNLLCQMLLTKLLQISRNCICTSATRSLTPSKYEVHSVS